MLIWVAASAAILAVAFANTVNRIVRASGSKAAGRADAILVFGAGLWAQGPSLTMRARVDEAARLYADGRAPVILCSGGYSGGLSEARVMRSLLIDAGVPAASVIPDDHGTSTRRALRAAARFGRSRWRRLIAVSSPYHLYRVAQEARRQGLTIETSAAERRERSTWRHVVFDVRQYLRETVATWSYAASAAAAAVAGHSLPVRAARHLAARFRYLAGGADQVATDSERIGIEIKSRVAGFSDTHAVHTPASGLQWPARGVIGDRFGMRHGRLHAGVDLRAALGSPVHAAAAGQVLFAGWMSSYGNLVVIHHGGGLATVYAHLAGFVVGEHDAVTEGQFLGFVGETGRSSGPHLHFEVRVHGSPVDPLIYLPTAVQDPHECNGQHNAVWAESIYLRGHDPKKPRRVLTDRVLNDLAARLNAHGIRYVYLFAGPFDDDGGVPDYALSPIARATVQRLRSIAPDLVVLPWLGGLQHGTVHLEDSRWVSRALSETERIVAELNVPGVHLDFEFILPGCDYVIRERGLTNAGAGLAEYSAWHIDFHRRLRERLPHAFLSAVIPSTASPVVAWKKRHTPEEAAMLAASVDQLSLLHYDTSIASRDTFRASLIEQLRHIADWKARPASAHVQYLLGVGTFVNARPLRAYRHLDVERLPHYFPALEQAIAEVQRDVRLVDGMAVFCDWTTSGREWQQFRQLWVNGAR